MHEEMTRHVSLNIHKLGDNKGWVPSFFQEIFEFLFVVVVVDDEDALATKGVSRLDDTWSNRLGVVKKTGCFLRHEMDGILAS